MFKHLMLAQARLTQFAQEEFMEIDALVSSLRESVSGNAKVSTVFGEPITAQGKTIIPVACIKYGFGAGSGNKPAKDPLAQGQSGGGGGGGGKVIPVGVVEVTAERTRYISFFSPGKMAAAAALGLFFGMWIGRRRNGRRRFGR
jgi:uncharacterized spore protein YtfJ